MARQAISARRSEKRAMQRQISYLDHAARSFPQRTDVRDAVRDCYSRCGVDPGRTGCDHAGRGETATSPKTAEGRGGDKRGLR